MSTPAPHFSVFTPSHDPRFLDEAHASLCDQTDGDWEWIVYLNGGATWKPSKRDVRVKIQSTTHHLGVGAAKASACESARGTILVELDHDDILLPTALERVRQAFERQPDAALVYSHTAQVLEDGSRDDSRYDLSSGWEYRDIQVGSQQLIHPVSFLPTPHNVSYIWFAPNHLRAFPRALYEHVGGYDTTRAVLDDQELMARLYRQGPFVLVDECLYLQRMHSTNTQRKHETNEFIQAETVRLYDLTIEENALAWARREGLLCLDFGAAHNRPDPYLGVDQYPGARVDFVATLPAPLDLPDSSVGVIRAVDFLEHVADKVSLFNELYRLLAPGGMLISRTPSTDGRGAFQDPTHVAFYNENSFWYFTEAGYASFVPELSARFQSSRLVTMFPTEWHQAHNIPYVAANLIAIKPDMPRNGGPLLV